MDDNLLAVFRDLRGTNLLRHASRHLHIITITSPKILKALFFPYVSEVYSPGLFLVSSKNALVHLIVRPIYFIFWGLSKSACILGSCACQNRTSTVCWKHQSRVKAAMLPYRFVHTKLVKIKIAQTCMTAFTNR